VTGQVILQFAETDAVDREQSADLHGRSACKLLYWSTFPSLCDIKKTRAQGPGKSNREVHVLPETGSDMRGYD